MKKFIAISLLSLVFISQVGYYFIASFERSSRKDSMRRELRSRRTEKNMQIVVLEDHAASIRWEDDGHEFSLHGKLYDVASVEIKNGKTLIHCVYDKDESQLAKDVAKTVASAHEKSTGKASKHTIKFQVYDYTLVSNDRTSFPLIALSTEYIDFDVAICPSFLNVETAPPRA